MMDHEIPKQYDPKSVEDRVSAQWLEQKAFVPQDGTADSRFSMVIPPPNVTGSLHMGHALNNTIQDIMVRYRRMQGRTTLWLPGTDHAGIATQNVVENALAERGIARDDLGRERFIQEVWNWKDTLVDRIALQLQKLGCSCDWDRMRFTMDSGLSKAVREVFVSLYERGLVYRGKYVVNWCPRCRTAISDEEVDHHETAGHLWFVKYDIKASTETIQVATTRPETMLGDTALAVNPADRRYRDYVGKTVIVPLVGREIPVVPSRAVDPDFGTGVVKVTPAHDPIDFQIARELGLPSVVIMSETGVMTQAAGEVFDGMDRFHCREAVLAQLKSEKRIGKIEKHTHSVGHCQRCNTIVEPYLSDQWFVKMKPLAEKALAALERDEPRIVPERWSRVYASWLLTIKDWCISRQLWWGHRIPVWYCTQCNREIVERMDPPACPTCGGVVEQDDDVLDTWFSSWLWPFSTLGWPDASDDLRRFYPTDLLVTGYDIIFFWVARMVMAGLEFTDTVPFKDVYFTGMVKDEMGRWMSKSLGNGIDPVEMIEEYSADAVRFSLAVLTTEGQDIHLAQTKFEMGRNFANKLWNAYRFLVLHDAILPHVQKETILALVQRSEMDLSDRWILSRQAEAIEEVTAYLESMKFSDAALTVYSFIWRDFCDWYVELMKSRIAGNASAGATAKAISSYILSVALRLLHPFMPFITEELWHRCFPTSGSLVLQRWPQPGAPVRDLEAEGDMDSLQGIIRVVRNIRGEMNVPASKLASLTVRTSDPQLRSSLERNLRYVQDLGKVRDLVITSSFERRGPMAAAVAGESEVFMSLDGLVDISAERSRLEKELHKTERTLMRSMQKLNNPDFMDKAPKNVIQGERDRVEELETTRAKLLDFLEALR